VDPMDNSKLSDKSVSSARSVSGAKNMQASESGLRDREGHKKERKSTYFIKIFRFISDLNYSQQFKLV
jgi:hypothetical protein